MSQSEFSAGPSQSIVVYTSDDTGSEINAVGFYASIAKDAEQRAAGGWRIVSTAAVPVRHAGALLGREGSGYETKVSVAVVYATA
ncbi:MAG: hypothetical protein ABSA21_05590 [Candidatus Limnocylindrales bacterium]|jgi:hypothetical protein